MQFGLPIHSDLRTTRGTNNLSVVRSSRKGRTYSKLKQNDFATELAERSINDWLSVLPDESFFSSLDEEGPIEFRRR